MIIEERMFDFFCSDFIQLDLEFWVDWVALRQLSGLFNFNPNIIIELIRDKLEKTQRMREGALVVPKQGEIYSAKISCRSEFPSVIWHVNSFSDWTFHHTSTKGQIFDRHHQTRQIEIPYSIKEYHRQSLKGFFF